MDWLSSIWVKTTAQNKFIGKQITLFSLDGCMGHVSTFKGLGVVEEIIIKGEHVFGKVFILKTAAGEEYRDNKGGPLYREVLIKNIQDIGKGVLVYYL
jgi:hypothetical protein